MMNFRILYMISAAIGCYYGSSMGGRRRKRFLVDAAGDTVNPGHPVLSLAQKRFGKYGLPRRDVILRYNNFEICYDNRNRQPNWVLEHLQRENVDSSSTSPKCPTLKYEYHADFRIPRFFQAEKRDYGDRFMTGRLASEDNYKGKPLATNDTYIYANTSPQDLMFDVGPWEQLENYVRNKICYYENVYVYTGPLFKSKYGLSMEYRITDHHRVAVPTHFFKIIIGELKNKTLHVGCFVLPNEPIPKDKELADFRVELDDIEKMTGFKLFRDRPFKGTLQEGNQQELFYDTRDLASKYPVALIEKSCPVRRTTLFNKLEKLSGKENELDGQSRTKKNLSDKFDFTPCRGYDSCSDDSEFDDFDLSELEESFSMAKDSEVVDFDEEIDERDFSYATSSAESSFAESSLDTSDDDSDTVQLKPVFTTEFRKSRAPGRKRQTGSEPLKSQLVTSPPKKTKTRQAAPCMRPQRAGTDRGTLSTQKRDLEAPEEQLSPPKKFKTEPPETETESPETKTEIDEPME